jgi:hypothetical protein
VKVDPKKLESAAEEHPIVKKMMNKYPQVTGLLDTAHTWLSEGIKDVFPKGTSRILRFRFDSRRHVLVCRWICRFRQWFW